MGKTSKLGLFLVGMVTCLASCATTSEFHHALDAALNSSDSLITKVISRPEYYQLQVLFTQIDRINNSVEFSDYEYRVNSNKYFYPASTVKLPIAVLALESLNKDERFNRNTRYYVEGDTAETTFESDIYQIFAVSDNEANNRLFEFLGQDRINNRLHELGAGPVRIAHRLSVPDADDVTTKAIIAYLNDSTTTSLDATVNTSPEPLKLKTIRKGKAFYAADSLIMEPMDFSLKNYYPLKTQHNILKRVIFPEAFTSAERFEISPEQRGFLLDAMQILPREYNYNADEYYDSYGKFFIYGDKTAPIPENVKIFNKVGYAYGTLTDCAYVKDEVNGVEFMITATILVNKDGVFNDDAYEYDSVGIPFLAALGREIYKYELQRNQ